MANGYYVPVRRVKADATPIDNVTKWAWDDDDYEEVQEWHEYTEAELDLMSRATLEEVSDALADASDAVSTNADDVATLSDAVAELSELVATLVPTETTTETEE